MSGILWIILATWLAAALPDHDRFAPVDLRCAPTRIKDMPTSAEGPVAEAQTQRLPPLKELITSPFGRRRAPGWLGRPGRVIRDHLGLDIRARLDWPVVAFKSGEVTSAGDHGLSGIMVEITQEDGMRAGYAHMGKTLVRKGQKVKTGDIVGVVGCTGRTTGSHLHFSLKDARGAFVDPLPYLQSAEQVLRPAPEQIPARLEPQRCRPYIGRRFYRPPPPRSSDINDF